MNLTTLEQAFKSNFVWRKRDGYKSLQTDPEIECSENTALVVFVGLAELYGFRPSEVWQHLALAKLEYLRHLNTYYTCMRVGAARQLGKKKIKPDLTDRVWTKVQIVNNCLRWTAPREYLPLRDLPH